MIHKQILRIFLHEKIFKSILDKDGERTAQLRSFVSSHLKNYKLITDQLSMQGFNKFDAYLLREGKIF